MDKECLDDCMIPARSTMPCLLRTLPFQGAGSDLSVLLLVSGISHALRKEHAVEQPESRAKRRNTEQETKNPDVSGADVGTRDMDGDFAMSLVE